MAEKISSIAGTLTAILIVCFLIAILACIRSVKQKQRLKKNLRMMGIILVAMVFTVTIGTSAYTQTDEYHENLVAKEKEQQAEIQSESESQEVIETEISTEMETAETTEESASSIPTEQDTSQTVLPEEIAEEETESETKAIQEAETEETSQETENQFVSDFANIVGADIANGAYDVLANQIGFKNLTFDSQMGETSNYKFYGDGTAMVITAMNDYYRVFIPSTDYIFYEDGEVLLTAEEYADTQIDQYDSYAYYIIAQDIITQCLKDPNTADFPSAVTHPEEIAFAKTGDVITVQSYVDSKNSLGATVRSQWTVQFIPTDLSTYSYEMKYINIDGESIGEYTEVN